MPRSKIPSPARSEGVKMTPRRHRFRSSRSVSSPARSDTSIKLSSIVQMHAMKSPVLSPLRTRRSILSDNTDIEVPGRKSWWRNLEENSRDVMEVFESKTTEQPDNIEEFIEADFKSQENDYTVDLPESSDGESIRSIVIPQRKFFSQKQTQAHELFNKIIENRDNLTHRKSKANTDNTIFVGKKNLFNRDTEERSRPVFPAGLLNMTEDKTLMNKTHDTTKHGQIRNLLGNRAGTKRKNMFAQFIMSESEDEIPDIQPNVFGFSKSKQQQQRKMSASQSTHTTSPKSNETDLEFDDWQHLPSSTMVDNEFGNTEDDSPVKRPRLSKTNSVIEAIQGNIRNKLNKTKQTILVPHSPEGEEDEDEATEKSNMKKNVLNDTYEKTLTTQITHAESDNNLGQSAAEIIQVDSDDENNFTLRYENDKNMQENDEIDITVKELVKDNPSTHEENTSTNITKKVLNSPSSLKGETNAINKSNNQPVSIETKEPCDANKMVNEDQSRNISWKVLETYQEHHAAINPREDLCEKDESKKTNTSASTINREDACDEIDNREISFERRNSSCHEEKTYFEATSTKNPQEESEIVERNQRNIMQEEEKSKKREDLKLHPLEAQQQINKSIDKVDEQEQKSLVVESMDVDDVNIDGKALNENQKEEGNHNYEVNNKDNAVPCKEKEIDYIAGDLKNIEKESAEETDKQSTTSSTHVNNETKHDLNENKKETAKGILIEEKQTETNCDENCEGEVEEQREKDNIVRYSTEKNEIPDKINKETQQIPITSLDENIDREDEENGDDNNEYKNVDEDENNAEDNKATNKSQEEPDDQMASVYENIQPEYEGSGKDGDEKQEHDDEQQEDDDEKDNMEESEVSNEMNEEIDKQTGISSMDVNIETEDEETPEDSDEEHREEDEDGENSEEENATTDKNNEESHNRGGISSVNCCIQTENGENNEEDDEEDDNAEENEMVNESNEETGNEIGMPLDENIETEDEEEGNSYEESHQEMNIESERRNDSNAKPDNHRVTFSKGRIYLTNITGESTNSLAEEVAEESDHEESRTRQLALEQCLMKIKNDNIERRRKIEEEVRNSLNAPLRKPLNNFNAPVRPRSSKPSQRTDIASAQTKTKAKKVTSLLNIDLPPEILDDLKYKPPRRYQPKNASWTTKRLYKYLESKLEPKYDYKARVMAEKLVKAMYEFTKEVRRHRVAPPISVDVLKQQMARTGVVSTHYDFYKFFRDFMPREIRIKVVPDVVNEIPLPRNGVFSDIV